MMQEARLAKPPEICCYGCKNDLHIHTCRTNGGTMPWEIKTIFEEVNKACKVPLGIHTHNDSEMGVANALTAVEAGATQVQGTINGYGERCGNCNLVSVIPNLKLKMGLDCISNEQMKGLKDLSAFVDELANRRWWRM